MQFLNFPVFLKAPCAEAFDKFSEIWDKIPEKIEQLPEEIDLDEDLFNDDKYDED